jgi:mRNA-degrading endonuclease toxin of MazEF toxin-antitoxin module
MNCIENKEYDRWNKAKKKINSINKDAICKKGQIWWCSVGKNVGVEQSCNNKNFVRPVLIIKVFSSKMFLAVPITSKNKKKYSNNIFYYDLNRFEKIKGFAILSQIKLFDNKRLVRKVTKIDKFNLNLIIISIKKLF